MSDFTSLGIVIFSMLIMSLLQLVPGIFALFRHAAYGKYSHAKASDMSLFFILGVEASVVITFLFIYIAISSAPFLCRLTSSPIYVWIITSIMAILGIAIITCYYRKGRGSELFISRELANNFNQQIQSAKSRSDAFVLGFLSPTPELLFTLPLYILLAITIATLNIVGQAKAFFILLFAISAIFPLLIMYAQSSRFNLAHIARFRFKNKPFFKAALATLYLLLAALIVLGVSL